MGDANAEILLGDGGGQRGDDCVGGVEGGGVVIDPLARYGRCAACGAWERRDALHGASIRIHHGIRADEIVTVRWCPACYARETESLRALAWDRTLVLGAQILANPIWADQAGVAHDPDALERPEAQRAMEGLRHDKFRGRAAVMALPEEADDSEAALRARGISLPDPVAMIRGAFARIEDEDDGAAD